MANGNDKRYYLMIVNWLIVDFLTKAIYVTDDDNDRHTQTHMYQWWHVFGTFEYFMNCFVYPSHHRTQCARPFSLYTVKQLCFVYVHWTNTRIPTSPDIPICIEKGQIYQYILLIRVESSIEMQKVCSCVCVGVCVVPFTYCTRNYEWTLIPCIVHTVGI